MREAHRTGFTTSKFRRVEQTRDRPDACNVALRSYLRFAEIQFNISIAIAGVSNLVQRNKSHGDGEYLEGT